MAVARIDAATGKTELASARVAVQSAAAERPRADALVRDRFVARRFNGRDNVLSGLSAVVAEGAAGLAFQSAEWIEHALAISRAKPALRFAAAHCCTDALLRSERSPRQKSIAESAANTSSIAASAGRPDTCRSG